MLTRKTAGLQVSWQLYGPLAFERETGHLVVCCFFKENKTKQKFAFQADPFCQLKDSGSFKSKPDSMPTHLDACLACH